jgi:CBS domain containing-hemolysin-like protein
MHEHGASLSTTERNLINRVLDLQNLRVGHVATPLEKAVCIAADEPADAALQLCRERQLTRLPVWKGAGAMRRIAGLVSLKDLLHAPQPTSGRSTAEFLRSALYLEHNTRLEDALRRMQRSGQHLAIVLGPDHKEWGLITLQDILQATFGEVHL